LITTLQSGVQSYAVNPQNGEIASIDQAGMLFINYSMFNTSPNSQYGHGGGSYRFVTLRWSPDGRYLAYSVETPNARNGDMAFQDTINDGVWVYEPATNQSRQVFRNEYRKGANIQIAYDFAWASDSHTLLIATAPNFQTLILVDSGTDINRH